MEQKLGKYLREAGPNIDYAVCQAQGRVHNLKLEQLTLHKISDSPDWLAAADRVVKTLLDQELRENEDFRRVAPGSYRIRLPLLTPLAGELRCSVLAEKVARELRPYDPAMANLDRDRSETEVPHQVPHTRPLKVALRAAAPTFLRNLTQEEEVTRNTSRAFEFMATGPIHTESAALTSMDRAALDDVDLNFHPVWHAKNRLITAYHCRASKDGIDLSTGELQAFLPSAAPDLLAAKIDFMVYEKAMKMAQWLLDQHLSALLILPLHLSTIDKPRFLSPIISLANTLPPQAANLVVFELVGIPQDVTRLRLRDRVALLRGRSRGLLARLDFEVHDLDIFKKNGFHGVSVDLEEAQYDDANLIKMFEVFVTAAEGGGLKSFAHSIATRAQNVAALGAGFTYIDGPIISPPASHPSHIRPFEIDMLYVV